MRNITKLFVSLLLLLPFAFSAYAQNTGSVKCIVSDNAGVLPGASVLIKGTTLGSITDAAGTAVIDKVPANAVLVVSFVGYESQEVAVDGRSVVKVTLKDDSVLLNETVVVGYGTQKKVNLTGAVDQVTSEVFEGRAVANVTQMLEGAVPNLNINLADGKPGRTADFNVRGTGSINGGSALVLIDGVEGDPSLLNPNDIETVSVLKDAAAAAIYGARAPYGVVLITTKEAKTGKAQVNYTGNFSIETPTNSPDVVTDGYVWADHFATAYYNYNNAWPSGMNKTQQFSLGWLEEYKKRHETGNFGTIISDGSWGLTKGRYVYFPEDVDYFGTMFKKSVVSTNHNISVSGSDGKFDYYLSGRYHYYDGLFNSDKQTDRYNSFNLRAKMGYQVAPWLKITNNLDYSFNKYYNPITYSEGSGVVYRNIADEGHPSSPILNPDGTLTFCGVYSVGDLLYGQSGQNTVNEVLKNTTGFAAQWLNNTLRLKGDFTYRKTTYERTKKEAYTDYSKQVDANGVSILETINDKSGNKFSETNTWNRYLAANIYGEYENTFGEKHYFKAMAGWNYEQSQQKQVYASNTDFVTNDIESLNLTLGTDNKSTTSTWSAYKFGGAFARVNYIFDERYLIEFNGRYDGSSRFPANHRWAFFPSVSAGWRVSQEHWWNVNPAAVSNLKIRASYGSLGNANGLGNYQYKQTMSISTSGYLLNGVKQRYTENPAALPEDLTWETATTYDLGIDAGFLNSRLTLNGDVYVRKTKDMIVAGPTVPDVFGASSPKGNYADMTTKGFEVSLAWHDSFNLGGKPFTYSVKGSLYDYVSTIDKYNNEKYTLSAAANQSLAGNYYVGMTIGELWGFESNGLWQNQSDIDAAVTKAQAAGQKYYNPIMQNSKSYTLYPGDLKIEDRNGNGYIDRGQNTVNDPGDRYIIGNEDPRFMYGINIDLDWNGIWVSAFFQGVGKQDWYPSNEASIIWGQYNRPYNNMPKWHLNNYWTEDNPDAFLPRYAGYYGPLYKGTDNANTRYLFDVSYCRLKNLQVGYKFNKKVTNALKMQGLAVYFSGENLFTWSPLYKYTKDINVSNIGKSDVDLSDSRGDGYNYPMMTSYTIGLNITF